MASKQREKVFVGDVPAYQLLNLPSV